MGRILIMNGSILIDLNVFKIKPKEYILAVKIFQILSELFLHELSNLLLMWLSKSTHVDKNI